MTTRILIVDDEPAITRMVKLNLERTGNYEVHTENQGRQAIAAARTFQPELIILDIMMPDLSGDEISQQLKEDTDLSKIKVIFMTAIVTHAETDTMGHDIGGQVFLAKPVNTQEMIETIEKVLASE